MRDHEKRQTLRRLWMERPPHERSEQDLLVFHDWIAENFPSLLPRGGDTVDQLRADIGELVEPLTA